MKKRGKEGGENEAPGVVQWLDPALSALGPALFGFSGPGARGATTAPELREGASRQPGLPPWALGGPWGPTASRRITLGDVA